MSIYIGISLNDDFTDFCCGSEEHKMSVPTVILREKNTRKWLIGEKAYKSALAGSGVIVDKLLSLVRRNGMATIENVRYSGNELLLFFLKELISEGISRYQEEIRKEEREKRGLGDSEESSESGSLPTPKNVSAPAAYDFSSVTEIAVSIRKAEKDMIDAVFGALELLGIPKDRIHVVSHTETFARFVLKQDRNLYNRMVGMFELSNQCLYYYEMQVSRGVQRYAAAGSEAQEEAFNLEILKTPSGEKIADQILRTLAERNMSGKSYSSVFLTGRGFESTDFAKSFMEYILSRRRVCIETRIFSIGAMYYAEDLGEGREDEYLILCDSRSSANIFVKCQKDGRETSLPIVRAGSIWTEDPEEYSFVLDHQDYIDFQVQKLPNLRRPRQLRMMLSAFPERENRTTKVKIHSHFLDSTHLLVTAEDLGFGDIFPTSGQKLTEVIDLEEDEEQA